MFDVSGYSSTSEYFPDPHSTISKKKKSKYKRRFNDDQIRSLEVMFENETKLEPGQKVELAKELGLQPRQVAIWFQNRRARWKSKQIEKDYSLLLDNYNNLTCHFESLSKENQCLLIQLEKLKNGMTGKPSKIQDTGNNTSTNRGESHCKEIDFEDPKSISNYEGIPSDEDGSIKFLSLEEEETDLLKIMEPIAGDSTSLSSTDQDWDDLDYVDLINQPTHWLDFWS